MAIAETDGQIVGVGQHGRRGADHVVYKLYVHPQHRGRGLGPQLLDALTRQLPANADRLYIEHFVANERAGAFMSVRASPWSGLNQVLRKTLHSGSCGVRGVDDTWPGSCRFPIPSPPQVPLSGPLPGGKRERSAGIYRTPEAASARTGSQRGGSAA